MKNYINNKFINLPFAYNYLVIKVRSILPFVLFVSLVLLANEVFAADKPGEKEGLFANLTTTGSGIFTGMRNIIYAVSGFGIIGIAIAGFFGSINWRWLSAIIIGLMVIASTAAILNYLVGGETDTITSIHDTLVNATGE